VSQPTVWSNAAGARYGAHDHPYDKVVAVEAGSIVFGLPSSGDAIELAIGDRLELPAGTVHDAVVGPDGVRCAESHFGSGTFDTVTRRAAGTW
jgi:quercetin dioxygenase-like cupin family protein